MQEENSTDDTLSDFLNPNKMQRFYDTRQLIYDTIHKKNWEYKEEQPCVVHHSRLKIVLVYLLFISFLTLISIRNPLPAIFIGSYCLLSSLMLYKSRRPLLDHFAGFIENFIFREVGANHIFWKRGRIYDEEVDVKYNVNTQKCPSPTLVFLFSKSNIKSMPKALHLSLPILSILLSGCLYINLELNFTTLFLSTFLISLLLLLIYDKNEMPDVLKENFPVIQKIIDDHQNHIEADSTYQDSFTLEQNASYNIIIGIIEDGIFFKGYKTFLDSYSIFFPENHTEFFLCMQKQDSLQIQKSQHPSMILDSIPEIAIDSFTSMDRTHNFIQDYFLSKKHSLSIIEGDMTTNDFEVFVDKLVKASANIKIEPEETNNEETNNEETRDSE